MKPAFKALYHFENGTHSIVEIKRTDQEEDADASDIYKWLHIDKSSLCVDQLWFSSMESTADREERHFEQGHLSFNTSECTFIEKYNSEMHQLSNKSQEKVPAVLLSAIEKFLSA